MMRTREQTFQTSHQNNEDEDINVNETRDKQNSVEM